MKSIFKLAIRAQSIQLIEGHYQTEEHDSRDDYLFEPEGSNR